MSRSDVMRASWTYSREELLCDGAADGTILQNAVSTCSRQNSGSGPSSPPQWPRFPKRRGTSTGHRTTHHVWTAGKRLLTDGAPRNENLIMTSSGVERPRCVYCQRGSAEGAKLSREHAFTDRAFDLLRVRGSDVHAASPRWAGLKPIEG
jgi:hypothetical protein